MAVTSAGRARAVVLVGPPAAGKTTVGRALAAALDTEFRDTDHDVEEETSSTVADLFLTEGEPHFRALEEGAVTRALAEHTGVLALGGGAVTSAATRALLVEHGRAGGTVVWLDVDLASAAQRIGLSRARPILGVNPRQMLRQMLATRAPLYDEVATLALQTGSLSVADVVTDIVAALTAVGTNR